MTSIDDVVQKAYDDLVNDPDSFEVVVIKIHKLFPDATNEEINNIIMQQIIQEQRQIQEKKLEVNRRDLGVQRLTSKILPNSCDSSGEREQISKIKIALRKTIEAETHIERENFADLLDDYASTEIQKIARRKEVLIDLQGGDDVK